MTLKAENKNSNKQQNYYVAKIKIPKINFLKVIIFLDLYVIKCREQIIDIHLMLYCI